MISSPAEAHRVVPAALDKALAEAERAWNKGQSITPQLTRTFLNALDHIATQSEKSSTAFTNIITSLAIKSALPKIDIRYHQEQIQDQTRKGAGFSFRTVSEDDVYPWLQEQRFDGAKSGWQTRTYERDDPYDLKYPHKIGGGKNSLLKINFLTVYARVEQHAESAGEALRYLLFRQVEKRHTQTIDFVTPKTKNIDLIVDIFTRHFFFDYGGAKGASRLPVLALHALYSIILPETARLRDKELKPLEAHVAADKRTGALGDIEVIGKRGAIFEAVEVKHSQRIDDKVLTTAQDKIGKSGVKRYYILTTHKENMPSAAQTARIAKIEELYDCVVIINGVQSTLRYYLRLVADPSAIFPPYIELLSSDAALSHEHRTAWNTVTSV
ncbi:MAG: hypothetical protein ABIO43_12730 [Sphingomicrobium sp.]